MWVVLYPALLLGIYLFVYLVVFRVRFPGYSEMDYVIYVFAGLAPYLGFMEALTAGAVSIKQNMHLVRNVMLPIELIPVRAVLAALATEMVALAVVIALAAINDALSPNVVWLPVAIALQVVFLVGLVLILASLAVALPDVTYFVNLAVLMLMFLSPIGFKPDMVPAGFAAIVYLNPIHYMTDAFRMSILASQPFNLASLTIYAVISVATFAAGAAFFRRFKGVLVDYE
jgi:lipopolysaccharide transport system permease protein